MGVPWALRADAVTLALASHPGLVERFRLARTTLRARVPAKAYCFRLPLVLGFRDFFHGIDKPAAQKVVNWLQCLNSCLVLLRLRYLSPRGIMLVHCRRLATDCVLFSIA
jgi:hypothetical protein